jgi:PAS domain S-box-containing protein
MSEKVNSTPASDSGQSRLLGAAYGASPFCEPHTPPILRALGDAGIAADPGLLRLLLDSLPALVSYVTRDLHYGWLNHSYEEWFGRSRRELIGKPIRQVLGDAVFERIAPYARQALAGEVVNYENTIDHRDGTPRRLHITYVPHHDVDQTVVGLFVLVFDVTEHWETEGRLRESELRFRQLAENIQEVFWMSSPSGDEFLYVSLAFEKIWQRSVADLSRNPTLWQDAIHADDVGRVRALFTAETLAQGGFDVEYRVLRPDGSTRWIHDRGFPVRDDAGRVLRIAGLAEDITDIKQAEDRERQLLADLAHMARLTTMGEMASGLAHELNQPLAAIINYVDACMQMLRARGDTDPDLRRAMEDAAAEAERAGKIIHRMNNFLRRTETRQTAIDLNLLVREALALAARDIRLGEVRLLLDLASDLPPALADRIQIEQVMLNLVRNALEAMQQKAAESRILTVRTKRAGADAVQVKVADTGCGLGPDAADRLFQPFYTTKPNGMGMGLAISRTILSAHGGRLEAAPGADAGAVFTFTLPIDIRGVGQ